MLTINDASKRTNLPVKTIRYYDEVGLVLATGRTPAGYRLYDDRSCQKLGFVQRARQFNFSIEECRELLSLYEDHGRPSRDVKKITLSKLALLQKQLDDLTTLTLELQTLANQCTGDDRPDCPILNDFSAGPIEAKP